MFQTWGLRPQAPPRWPTPSWPAAPGRQAARVWAQVGWGRPDREAGGGRQRPHRSGASSPVATGSGPRGEPRSGARGRSSRSKTRARTPPFQVRFKRSSMRPSSRLNQAVLGGHSRWVGPGDVATKALERGAVVCRDMDIGVQLESGVAPRTQTLFSRSVARRPGARPDDPVIRRQRRALPRARERGSQGERRRRGGRNTTSSWWGWASSSSSAEPLARRASKRRTRASTRATIASTSASFGGGSRTKRTAPVSVS